MTRGLEIRFVEDVGPLTKIIYALKEFPDCLIANCDDDTFYPRDWLAQLLAAHARYPDCIICHRTRKVTFDKDGALLPYLNWKLVDSTEPSLFVFPVCVMGILYPPRSLHSEVFNIAAFRKLCPKADDIWMKAMSLLAGTRCHNLAPFPALFPLISGTQEKSLWSENKFGGNDTQLQAVIGHYDLLRHLPKNDFALSPAADLSK